MILGDRLTLAYPSAPGSSMVTSNISPIDPTSCGLLLGARRCLAIACSENARDGRAERGDVPNGIRWSIRRHARWRPRSDCASCRKDDRVTTIMEASEAWVLPERPPALLGVCVPIAAAIRPSFGYRAGAGAVLGPSPFACQASSQAEDRQSASPGLTATSCRLMCQMVCRCSRAAAIVHTIWGRHGSACHAADEHDRSTQPRP